MKEEVLQPKYKQVKMTVAHCPKCKEMLMGNNSFISPWECACGVWKPYFQGGSVDYKIIPHKDVCPHTT